MQAVVGQRGYAVQARPSGVATIGQDHDQGRRRAAVSGRSAGSQLTVQVKKPFHRLLLKLVHPDCWLSEPRFDFHNVRVSGEKPHWFKSPPPRPRPSVRISSEHQNAFSEVPNDALDYPRNFSPDRPLADRIGHANLEMVEPLARVGMRKGNAAAQRWRAASRRGKTFRGEPGGADAAGSRQDNGNIDQAGKADATDRCHRGAVETAALLAD
jgi:hypothetical protein